MVQAAEVAERMAAEESDIVDWVVPWKENMSAELVAILEFDQMVGKSLAGIQKELDFGGTG